MFKDMHEAMSWARANYPGCSFSVKEQPDGPTIISVKGKDGALRTIIYVKRKYGGE